MDIKSMYLAEIEQWMKEHGQPAFRAKQVFQWMHQKYVASTEDMSNLPKALRAQMDEEGFVHIEAEMSQESKSDGTIKFLYRLSDGQMIETVFMRHNYGNSVCISSQAGCRMGCRFCASTIGGLTRNLLPSEMLDQIYAITRLTGERVSNVVVMGTGEPMDNYDNILKFLHLLTDHSKEGNLLRQRIAEQKENGPVDLLVRQIIDSARAKGELREDIPLSYITNALLARMISYLMYQCHHIGNDMPPEEMRRLVTESIMNELCKKNI